MPTKVEPKNKKGAGYVGSIWKKYRGPVYPEGPPPTHCLHCGEALVVGSHSPLELGMLCANIRLHDRIEALEIELAHARKAAPEEEAPQIELVSEEIAFEPVL